MCKESLEKERRLVATLSVSVKGYIEPKIDQEYKNLVPQIGELEYKALRDSIKEKGQWESIKINSKGVVLDGINRLRACQELSIKPQFETVDFPNANLERCYVIEINLRRRHLTDYQKIELSKELLDLERKHAHERQSKGGKTFGSGKQEIKPETGAKEESKGNAVDKVAEKIGVSSRNYYKGLSISENAPPVIKNQLRNNKLSIEKAYKQTKALNLAPAAEKNKIIEKLESGGAKDVWDARSQVRKELGAEYMRKGLIEYHKGSSELLIGDFMRVGKVIKDNSVALIITDPPYAEKYLPLWADLAKFAARVLKPGGYLIAYSGQMFLPDVFDSLRKHLNYYWMATVQHSSSQTQIFPRKVRNRFKPLLIFTKGKKPRDHEWFFDLLDGEKGDKEMHEWAQSESEAAYFVEKFTLPGETVADPLCGVGTFLKPARDLDRKVIGIEIERSSFEMAVAALMETGEKS